MVRQRVRLPWVILVLILMGVAAYDGIRLADDKRFNDLLTADNAGQFAGSDDPFRQFAKARGLLQPGDFKDAVKAYAAIDLSPDDELYIDVKYNLANLYFREATRMREEAADDLAMPLVELAKQNYKDILRIDSHHWNAKYNLELALILSPDIEAADALEERNPEHSTRALTRIQSREPLP